MLVVDDLAVRRGGRTILTALSLHVDAGEIVGIVGKNGCGKSTLLAAIAGVLAPHAGIIMIDTAPPSGAAAIDTAVLRGSQPDRAVLRGSQSDRASVWGSQPDRARARAALGFVPEAADPPGFLTGVELWTLAAAARRCEAPTPSLIDALGLDELRAKPLDKMSLGQRRRACLGAAFLGPPKLLVLDEPDNGLDAKHLASLVALLRAHATAGGACILASHDTALLDELSARRVPLA